MTLTACEVTAAEAPFDRVSKTIPHPLSWGAALWSVVSVRWATVALLLFLAGLVAQLNGAPEAMWWTLYLACYSAGGWGSAWAGAQALRNKALDVDLLMIAAAVGAVAIGQIFDGALLIVIFATSGALDDIATRHTAESVKGLLDLAPDQAVVVQGDGSERVVAASELVVGDRVVVRPGDRIPADGAVLSGASDVDQRSITGESMPVAKARGDEVFAGTVNGSGVLHLVVTRDPSQTVVARIVELVADASATKAKTQLFIEKIEQRYSLGMVAATLALIVIPLMFGADLRPVLLRAMTFMIVASPCAVVLATMPPLLSAIANAGRHGVLVKSAVVVERLADTSIVALDKTGTLTRGIPRLASVAPLDPNVVDARRLLQIGSCRRTIQRAPAWPGDRRGSSSAWYRHTARQGLPRGPGLRGPRPGGQRFRRDRQPAKLPRCTASRAGAAPFCRRHCRHRLVGWSCHRCARAHRSASSGCRGVRRGDGCIDRRTTGAAHG